MTAHHPLNLGHRGASSLAPENTLAAFRLAREIGADGIEFDVKLSQDGVPVIMHDDRLERTSNGHGRVDETAWSVLRRLDAGRWFDLRFAGEAIPTLQDVIDEFGASLLLNIELKASTRGAELVEQVVACVLRNELAGHVIISSFDWRLLEHVRALDPALRVGVLFRQAVSALEYEALQPDAIHPEQQLMTASMVAAAHQHNQAVNTWTVDREDDMLRMIALGVNAIITNYPQRLKDVMHGLESADL